eukprot:gb/GEZJ01007271.1/.p1 GENE.gb/GEZJ01007271.1/~~gb/GEZJ01007271.1/.p1  ORF type:complete len:188 (+),score=5.51 gb/GEZJ01007271.1/:246-809(+)
MQDCNATHTPYNNVKALDQQPPTKPLTAKESTRYRQILGEIRYVTDSTRPDIAYATNRLAQHMSKPQHHHQKALKTLLRYLKGTRTHGLCFSSSQHKPSNTTKPAPRLQRCRLRQRKGPPINHRNHPQHPWHTHLLGLTETERSRAVYNGSRLQSSHRRNAAHDLDIKTSTISKPTTTQPNSALHRQ